MRTAIDKLEKTITEMDNSWKEQDCDKEYYDKTILPALMEWFEKKHTTETEYDVLIVPVGFSPPPCAFAVRAIRARKVHFICSKDSRKYLDTVVALSKLSRERYDEEKITKDSPEEIFKCVNEIIKAARACNPNARIAADLTGGTKLMPASIALVASVFENIDLYYIASEQFSLQGKSLFKPMSEELKIIPNPIATFGILDEKRAVQLFDSYNYAAAAQLFEKLIKYLPHPRVGKIISDLSHAYDSIERLNFKEAQKRLEEIENDFKYLHTDQKEELPFKIDCMKKTLSYVKTLAECKHENNNLSRQYLEDPEVIRAYLIAFYHYAQRCLETERSELAALVAYRAFEMTGQARLMQQYGVFVDEPDFSKIITEAELLQKAKEKWSKDKKAWDRVPHKLALLDIFRALMVLEDEYFAKLNPDMNELSGKTESRNKSIFTHGFQKTSDAKKNVQYFLGAVSTYFELVYPNERLDDYQFVKLGENVQ